MKENFKNLYNEYEVTKCFGMFGYNHVFLEGFYDEEINFANYLNSEFNETLGKVCSIAVDYNNCYYMNTDGTPIAIDIIYSEKLNNIMADASTEDLALFPLKNEDSIFVKDEITNIYQYFLMIKNSPASTRYKN